ncbi:AdoMet_MTases domain containing protein [Flavobacteriaceae bacterium]
MAFSKKEHLKHNIEALRIAFRLEREKRQATETERKQMMLYSGFGGLKFVLNPVDTPSAIGKWVKSEQDLFSHTQELYKLLRENAADEKQYHQFVDSMRSSVLTAFYTPPPVIEAIVKSIKENEINIQRFLEPSAGIGAFIETLKNDGISQITAYEKELLTGKVLKQINPNSSIRITGFEEIPDSEKESYDVIASNIPFGDISVFDLSFVRSKDVVRVQATRSIHNYFFLKGIDVLRDGGVMAFITSQGVLNSQKNEPIRQGLMQNCNLISAIRLPNNLFTDYAGTEVGSDLIILQKNTNKQGLSELENRFCQTYTTSDNTINNVLFENPQRVVHTSFHKGTDMYGKPTWIYQHQDGIEGIAKDLKEMLTADFATRFDIGLYNGQHNLETRLHTLYEPKQMSSVSEEQTIQQKQQDLFTPTNSKANEVQLSLFDLFENEVKTVATVNPVKTKKPTSYKKKSTNGRQGSLFSGMEQFYAPKASATPKNSNKQALVGDLFSGTDGNGQNKTTHLINEIPSPAIYTGKIQPFHRNECLVIDKGHIGSLKDFDNDNGQAIFHPLHLTPNQKTRAEAYVSIRDVYLDLYWKETEKQTEHKQEREMLNKLYDAFVKRYGNLNNAENIKLIKTDSAGKEIPYLERVIGGVVHKADIFHQPVSFSISTLATDNPDEALAASLNKYGTVRLDYMSQISGLSVDNLKENLAGRIFYNPLEKEYEISERWVSGNVVAKAETIKEHLLLQPNDKEASQSLEALEKAFPRRIEFDELDFNLGERWIPMGIYNRFTSYLFDADVRIHYTENTDDFSINCNKKNIHITEKALRLN